MGTNSFIFILLPPNLRFLLGPGPPSDFRALGGRGLQEFLAIIYLILVSKVYYCPKSHRFGCHYNNETSEIGAKKAKFWTPVGPWNWGEPLRWHKLLGPARVTEIQDDRSCMLTRTRFLGS